MRAISVRAAVLAGCMMLGACATVNSNPIGHGANGGMFDANGVAPAAQAGIAYFMPRQLVKVTVSRKSVKLTDAIDAFAKAQLAVATGEAAVAEAEAAIRSTQNAIVDNKDSPEAIAILQARLKEFEGAKTAADTKLVTLKARVDAARLALEAARQGQAREVNLSNLRSALATTRTIKEQAQRNHTVAATEHEAAKTAYDKAKAAYDVNPVDASLKVALDKAEAKRNGSQQSLDNLKLLLDLATSDEAILAQAAAHRQAAGGQGLDGLDGRVDPTHVVTVDMSLQAPTADPTAGYRLDPVHSVLRDDNHKLTLTAEGLITSTDTVAIDRTGDVVVQLASFAGAVHGFGVPSTNFKGFAESWFKATGAPKVQPRRIDCRFAPQIITAVVDLTSRPQVNDLNRKMACLGAQLEVRQDEPLGGSLPGNRLTAVPVDGIAYRTPTSVYVDVLKCEQGMHECMLVEDGINDPVRNGRWVTAQTLALSLPQAGPVSFVRQNAGFMTKTGYKLTFKDGILMGYDASRPSELAEAAGLPMRVVNSAFEGVSKVLTLRIGANKQRAELTDGQRLIEDAKTNLAAAALTGDKKLVDEQVNLLKARIALQQSPIDGGKSLADADLKLLNALNALDTARIQTPANTSTTQLGALITQMRNQARLEAINKCVSEKIAAGSAYDACLADP